MSYKWKVVHNNKIARKTVEHARSSNTTFGGNQF